MRALVVGADGFVGRWLVRHLADHGDAVDAIVGPHFQPPLAGAVRLQQVDVRDTDGLAGVVVDTRPQAIYYLAGVSQRGQRDSFQSAVGISVAGVLNALTAAAAVGEPVRLLYPSTGYVYRASADPVSEDSPTEPIGLYAAAKLAAEMALRSLSPLGGVQTIVARAFNHIGPGQSEAFLVPAIARQAAAVAAGESDVIRLGPISPVRDFCDVRDVVRAYRLLMLHGEPNGIYNVASGSGVSIGEMVQLVMDVAGVAARVESSIAEDAQAQAPILVGDATRLRQLGWTPEHGLRDTLADVLAEYRPVG